MAVSGERFKAEVNPNASSGGDELLAFHPSATVGLTGMYGAGLLIPVQFSPVVDSVDPRKRAMKMQPPTKVGSGQKYPMGAGGRWASLTQLRTRGALASALAGRLEWTDPAVTPYDSFSELMTQPL